MVKTAVESKMAAWMEVLRAKDETAKERGMKVYKGEKRNVKMSIYLSKKEVNKQFGKMIQDVGGNRKLLWKEVGEVNGENMENYNSIEDRNGRLAVGEDEVRKTWKDYFEDLYEMYIQQQSSPHVRGWWCAMR